MVPTPNVIRSEPEEVLYVALELSTTYFRVVSGRPTGRRRQKPIPAQSLGALREELALAKNKVGLPQDARIVCCYEAGFTGFWLHRQLEKWGIESYIFKSSVLKRSKKKTRKTDRLDGDSLFETLVRWHHFDLDRRLTPVAVPGQDTDDHRRLHRERETLKKERNRHRDRVRGLLLLYGMKPNWRRADPLQGLEFRPHQEAELRRQLGRLELVSQQLKELEATRKEIFENSNTREAKVARHLSRLVAIGINGSWTLAYEYFGWRKFRNRRQVGALAGLVGVPHQSGKMDRDLGISKEGNTQVRALMIELSWLWIRHQPRSALTLWFKRRFGEGKRHRKVGIVALARRLLVALWHYVEQGLIPEGARCSPC